MQENIRFFLLLLLFPVIANDEMLLEYNGL